MRNTPSLDSFDAGTGGRAIYRAMFEDLPAIDLGKLKYLNPKGELVEPHSATRDEDLIKRYCPGPQRLTCRLPG